MFTLLSTKAQTEMGTKFTRVPLSLSKATYIEPLSKALIRHGISLADTPRDADVWLVREPNSLLKLNLLVDQGPIYAGEVITTVFNLSDQPVRIAKGEVISWLVEM